MLLIALLLNVAIYLSGLYRIYCTVKEISPRVIMYFLFAIHKCGAPAGEGVIHAALSVE